MDDTGEAVDLVDGGEARAKPSLRGGEEGSNSSLDERKNTAFHELCDVCLVGLYEAGAALLFLSPLKIGKKWARRKEAGA